MEVSATRIGKKHAAKVPLKACSVLLLLLYLAGTIQVDTFHHWVHTGEAETVHSPEQEKDPCHRTVYHHDRDNGCDHKSHIKSNEKCALCGIVLHTEHLVSVRPADILQKADELPKTACRSLPAAGFSIYQSSRAPPVL